LGNYTGAIQYYHKALAIDAKNLDALNNKLYKSLRFIIKKVKDSEIFTFIVSIFRWLALYWYPKKTIVRIPYRDLSILSG
jgi:hypothetical protein